MKMQTVSSSNISAIGYDLDAKTLTVQFKSGAAWRYGKVSAKDAAKLLAADSIGRHFAAHIRPIFAGRMVEQEDT